MDITPTQKQIYNLYLRSFRLNNGKPFRAKKDFSDIEKNNDIKISLLKIENLFNKYPAFFGSLYFDAPYKIFPDEKFFSLKFYGSNKGISTCVNYINYLNSTKPENQKEFIQNSFKFIASFCISKEIPIERYTTITSVVRKDCIKHLQEHCISWYTIFVIPGLFDVVRSLPKDEFELYFGDKIDMNSIICNYESSVEFKKSLKKMYALTKQFIENKIKKDK